MYRGDREILEEMSDEVERPLTATGSAPSQKPSSQAVFVSKLSHIMACSSKAAQLAKWGSSEWLWAARAVFTFPFLEIILLTLVSCFLPLPTTSETPRWAIRAHLGSSHQSPSWGKPFKAHLDCLAYCEAVYKVQMNSSGLSSILFIFIFFFFYSCSVVSLFVYI